MDISSLEEQEIQYRNSLSREDYAKYCEQNRNYYQIDLIQDAIQMLLDSAETDEERESAPRRVFEAFGINVMSIEDFENYQKTKL